MEVEITGLSTRTFTVKNISYINAPENMTVEVLTNSLDVVIRGTEEQLDQLSADSIRSDGFFVLPQNRLLGTRCNRPLSDQCQA